MKVKYTSEAQTQARQDRSRWRKYRDSKDVFDQDLSASRVFLASGPKLAVYGLLAGRPVRRTQLKRLKVHLYYVIYEELNLVRIVSVWGSHRGDAPVFDEE